MTEKKVSVVLLAAGNSERMGTGKAFLTFPDGRTFAEFLITQYQTFGVDQVVLVVNEKFDHSEVEMPGIRVVVNHHMERGRGYSIRLGLEQIPEDSHCFIHNIDNPFLNQDLLRILFSNVIREGYVVPYEGGKGGHPILLGDRIVAEFILGEDKLDFRNFLEAFSRIEVVFPDPGIHWNINTPLDYKQFMDSSGRTDQ